MVAFEQIAASICFGSLQTSETALHVVRQGSGAGQACPDVASLGECGAAETQNFAIVDAGHLSE